MNKSIVHRSYRTILITSILLLLVIRYVNSETLIDSIIAIIDSQPITQSDLMNEFRIEGIINRGITNEPNEEDKRDYLNRIINRKLVLKEAEHIGITTIDRNEQVVDRLTEISGTYTNKKGFNTILRTQGIEVEVLRQWIHDSIVFDDYYKLQFINSIDNREVDDLAPQYFEANKSDFIVPEKVTMNSIRIVSTEHDKKETQILAEKIMEQLNQRVSFNKIKKEYQTNPVVSVNVETNPTDSFLGAIVSELRPLEYKGPITIPQGYIIVKQIKKIPSRQRQYSEVKVEIAKLIREKKAKIEYEKWLAKQKSRISWYILDEALNRISNITIPSMK
ncbi:peptidyl-prolyl cis-trans isomerase [Candidatus Poribacteria bacterium]|nr:peptidyl-prolyl cis-trans isomerase [Candidatus Poribacteria bacterium]